MGAFPVSLMQPSEGLGQWNSASIAQIDQWRGQILVKLREVRAQMSRTSDPELLSDLKASEQYGIAALNELAQAANRKELGLFTRAIIIAEDAVRAMGSAVKEVVIETASAAGETLGAAAKPIVPALWPLAIGLVAIAFIWGGGIKTGKK